jgi:Aspartyl protease
MMLVDTGGIASMLSASSVKALHYPIYLVSYGQMVIYGGARADRYFDARNIDLGGLKAEKMEMFVLPGGGALSSGEDGVIGPQVLRQYDVDFDFANARLNLFLQDHCPYHVVYWTNGPAARVPFKLDEDYHITLHVLIDGKDVDGAIDTGADESVMSLENAEDLFGFDDKSPLLKRVSESDQPPAYRYPFKTLALGDVAVETPDLVLIPDWESRMPPGPGRLIIGMDILRQLHLFIAYSEQNLYVTPASQH